MGVVFDCSSPEIYLYIEIYTVVGADSCTVLQLLHAFLGK